MFPEADLPGVDLVVPSLEYLDLRGGKVDALVLTHGHEDHIGGVPYVLPRVTGPVMGTPFTLALVEHKIEEHGLELGARKHPVQPGDNVTVGPFRIEFIRVTHSIPDCVAVAIHTPQGVLIHTGDFKIDYTPLDHQPTDLGPARAAGRRRRAGALCRQHQRRPARRDRLRDRCARRLRRGLLHHRRQGGRGGVCLERLPHAAHRRPGGAVRPLGGVRRTRHAVELRDRAAARLPARAHRRGREGQRRAQSAAARRGLSRDRLARRTECGALAYCHRRPSPHLARARRHGRALGAGHSRATRRRSAAS